MNKPSRGFIEARQPKLKYGDGVGEKSWFRDCSVSITRWCTMKLREGISAQVSSSYLIMIKITKPTKSSHRKLQKRRFVEKRRSAPLSVAVVVPTGSVPSARSCDTGLPPTSPVPYSWCSHSI
ncbi:hypothetical protein AVEN_97196-1 [Araneus ventricosus]|uniref:Uncharacterized protein n=1 Tax=Araneus ventricosus TaxID=182803 RepID=A0A4Y2DEM6_ARAVE|nr:hypothetical protein AVEN_97196-1 [Araneus ventricosus]